MHSAFADDLYGMDLFTSRERRTNYIICIKIVQIIIKTLYFFHIMYTKNGYNLISKGKEAEKPAPCKIPPRRA